MFEEAKNNSIFVDSSTSKSLHTSRYKRNKARPTLTSLGKKVEQNE